MDDSDSYLALFGIDWAFYNNAVLNLKKRLMLFETNILCMVSSLDIYEGERYNEPVDEDAWRSTIENIYRITRHLEDYINPTTYK
jgi:hypothetical protein